MATTHAPARSEDDVVPLILCQSGNFEPVEETLAWLRTITKRISVVCCVGKYRTGKSFLLNTLARTSAFTGFLVGRSVQACTKGLWLMRSPLFEDERTCVLLMDSEGIDSLEANDNHDVTVFTLALLLSSIFCYNSTGALDEAAMQTLSLVTNVCERVRSSVKVADGGDAETTYKGRPDALADEMPQFIWILRDFALQLQTRSGTQCGPDQYLEEALNDDSSCGEGRSRVRHVIRSAFPDRALVTLPHPAINNQQNLTNGNQNIAFRSAVDALRERLMDTSRCLRVKAQPMTGGMYAAAAIELCNAINTSGTVPTLRDSWTLLADCQAKDLMMNTVERANTAMRRAVSDSMTTASARCALNDCVEEHFRQFCDEPLLATRSEEADAATRSKLQSLRDEFMIAHATRRQSALAQVVGAVGSEREGTWLASLRAVLPSELKSELATRAEVDSGGHHFDETKFVCALVCERLVDEWGPGLVRAHDATRDQLRDANTLHDAECEEMRRCAAEASSTHELQMQDAIRAATSQVDHLNEVIAVLTEELAEARECARRCMEQTQGIRNIRDGEANTKPSGLEEGHEQAERGGRGKRVASVSPEDREDREDREDPESLEDPKSLEPPAPGEQVEKFDADLEERLGRAFENEERCRALEVKLEEAESARRILSERLSHTVGARDRLKSALVRTREEGDARVNRVELEAEGFRRRADSLHADLVESRVVAEEAQRTRDAMVAQATADRQSSHGIVRECREQTLAARASAEDNQARMMQAMDAHLKDTRQREIDHRKNIAQLNARVADAESSKIELLRRIDRLATESETVKRKAADIAPIEQELKRTRAQARAFEIQVVRLTTELDHSRKRCTDFVAEREKRDKDWMALLTHQEEAKNAIGRP